MTKQELFNELSEHAAELGRLQNMLNEKLFNEFKLFESDRSDEIDDEILKIVPGGHHDPVKVLTLLKFGEHFMEQNNLVCSDLVWKHL